MFTNTVAKNAAGSGFSTEQYGGAIIGHEADTGHMVPIKNIADRFEAEMSGYTTEFAAERGFNTINGTTSYETPAQLEKRIRDGASGSVTAACRGARPEEKSCQL